MHTDQRRHPIRRFIKTKGIDAFIVTSIKNVRYLTGFTGSSAFALITPDKNFVFTDFRYQEQISREVCGWEIIIEKGRRAATVNALAKRLKIKKLGFESSASYEFYKGLDDLKLKLIPASGLIEKARARKGPEEISKIRTAVERAEKAFLKIKPYVKAGVSEMSVALRLEEQLKKAGCRSVPFEIIVASGANSSMPHARPIQKKIEKGDFVIIDWGGEACGYYSDMTRTLLISGGPSDEKRKIYSIVDDAREKAVAAVKAGAGCRAVDAAARNRIKEAGYGDFFGHGTGHGVGLDVHEAPRLSWTSKEKISDGTIVTVEPGIYLPGVGGVRIEDMVLATREGCEMLTSLSRKLEVVG
ncbi:MAG: aminopeptidase P family protein [Nitrospirae bacterium]|nr:MAG: aminopeptidase P family protein [Nitrospirota bacterium]